MINKKGTIKQATPETPETPRQKVAQKTGKATSEYRASYMNLSSSLHQPPHSGRCNVLTAQTKTARIRNRPAATRRIYLPLRMTLWSVPGLVSFFNPLFRSRRAGSNIMRPIRVSETMPKTLSVHRNILNSPNVRVLSALSTTISYSAAFNCCAECNATTGTMASFAMCRRTPCATKHFLVNSSSFYPKTWN